MLSLELVVLDQEFISLLNYVGFMVGYRAKMGGFPKICFYGPENYAKRYYFQLRLVRRSVSNVE